MTHSWSFQEFQIYTMFFKKIYVSVWHFPIASGSHLHFLQVNQTLYLHPGGKWKVSCCTIPCSSMSRTNKRREEKNERLTKKKELKLSSILCSTVTKCCPRLLALVPLIALYKLHPFMAKPNLNKSQSKVWVQSVAWPVPTRIVLPC